MIPRRMLFTTICIWLLTAPFSTAEQVRTQPPNLTRPSAEEIVAQMEARNLEREMRLASYQVRRIYFVINYRTGRQAQQEVRMVYRAPDRKEFLEISASGSKFLRNRVFGPLMKSEQDVLQPQQKRRSALTHENYEFTLAGEDQLEGRRQFILMMSPRRQEKYLLEGKLWVDGEDFAVTRIEGQPVRRPSFWTRKVTYVRTYRKIGEFWLPAKDESVNEILLFGRSLFRIQHEDYTITSPESGPAHPSTSNSRN